MIETRRGGLRCGAAASVMTAGLVAGIVVGLAGCAPDTGVVGARVDQVSDYPNVTLSQPSLSQAVGFQPPSVAETESGLMRVSLPLRAKSNETLHVEHRVIWYDKGGHPIPPEMSWKPVRLEPRQPQNLSYTATSTEAADYSVQLRWGRP